ALERQLVSRKQKQTEMDRAKLAEQRENIIKERAAKLAALRDKFNAAVMGDDRQRARHDLEDIAEELFAIEEVGYAHSYRNATQQVDGHCNFLKFDYLVERNGGINNRLRARLERSSARWKRNWRARAVSSYPRLVIGKKSPRSLTGAGPISS